MHTYTQIQLMSKLTFVSKPLVPCSRLFYTQKPRTLPHHLTGLTDWKGASAQVIYRGASIQQRHSARVEAGVKGSREAPEQLPNPALFQVVQATWQVKITSSCSLSGMQRQGRDLEIRRARNQKKARGRKLGRCKPWSASQTRAKDWT